MLKYARITNFRSCLSTELTLEQPVSALVGKNGAGKTNLLKCVEWLAASASRPVPVQIKPAGNLNQLGAGDKVSVTAHISIDKSTYEYTLSCTFSDESFGGGELQLSETLAIADSASDFAEIFYREGEDIYISDRTEPVRVFPSTPAISALASLLPKHDSLHHHLTPIISFFKGVSYYSLVERPERRDEVPEGSYKEWLRGYTSEGMQTESVAFRLIYMWNEERELLKEFNSLIGPDGLGLIDSFEIISLEGPLVQGQQKSERSQERIYRPIFMPSAGMGGAGNRFRFSQLSVGTGRVIRMVTSLLFDRRSLMLIEQPEDSVHPGILRRLIDLIRSYSGLSQILFTTHSPEVLDILEPEELLLITANDGATNARKLSLEEVCSAKKYLKNEGSLSEYLDSFEE